MNILSTIKEKGSDSSSLQNEGISIFLNPFTYLKLRKNTSILSNSDHIYIDGQWLCNFLKWFKIIDVERVSFDNTSAAPMVLEEVNEKKETVALVGSDEVSARVFKEYVEFTYPDINIIYSRNGYFTDQEYRDSIQQISELKPELVIVGMGFLKQEQYLIDLFNEGYLGKAFTCGGFMHQTASKGHDYYPTWIDKWNLRFAYRVWDEPKLLKRYTVDYGKFVGAFLIDVFRMRKA